MDAQCGVADAVKAGWAPDTVRIARAAGRKASRLADGDAGMATSRPSGRNHIVRR